MGGSSSDRLCNKENFVVAIGITRYNFECTKSPLYLRHDKNAIEFTLSVLIYKSKICTVRIAREYKIDVDTCKFWELAAIYNLELIASKSVLSIYRQVFEKTSEMLLNMSKRSINLLDGSKNSFLMNSLKNWCVQSRLHIVRGIRWYKLVFSILHGFNNLIIWQNIFLFFPSDSFKLWIYLFI